MGQLGPIRLAVAGALALLLYSSGPAAADELANAIRLRDTKQVYSLLKAGADPNRHLSYGAAIGLASALGPPEVVVALLDAGADPQTPGSGGLAPLHQAVLSGQVEITRILLQRGAKVDARDNLGRTPLLTFASGSIDNLDVVKILLQAGADPNAVQQGDETSVLEYIALHGRVAEAELLVTAGARVNARNSLWGMTPLHYAVDCWDGAKGNHDMVRFLIAHGADVNAKDVDGLTPMNYVRKCSPNGALLISILVAAGAH
jgi:ankyrin repeat protein